MLSPEASETIANIGTLTLDQAHGFLPVAKSKTQEYVDLIAKARTSSRQSEEKYLHQDFDIFKPLEFSSQNPIFELHLANMEGMTAADLAAELSALSFAQTFHIMPIFQERSDKVTMSLRRVRTSIRDLEEQGQLSVEKYQRASHQKRQRLEPRLRRKLAYAEEALVELKNLKADLEMELACSIAVCEMVIKHLESLADKELAKENA
ncbi:hypothetical protein BOTNAR_0647g00050 [Botryotinia narcissicola]|uniref:Uncharacterized protein n=1 Tax=Botryotinia narcissicola TaxID=278944 RepID=A0A4Z1H959_9HELO|nr:hypothetical protein BOTNAR_0647g00050 [Botryotinia narcissicola]